MKNEEILIKKYGGDFLRRNFTLHSEFLISEHVDIQYMLSSFFIYILNIMSIEYRHNLSKCIFGGKPYLISLHDFTCIFTEPYLLLGASQKCKLMSQAIF